MARPGFEPCPRTPTHTWYHERYHWDWLKKAAENGESPVTTGLSSSRGGRI